MLRKALKRLSSTKGVGLDFWHPTEMLLLPWEALQEICDILNEAEETMVWPQQTYLNKMIFLNKPGGGDRTIGLASMLFRIWQRIRAPIVQEWEAKQAVEWDSASKGQGALKASMRREVEAEAAVLQGKEAAKLL